MSTRGSVPWLFNHTQALPICTTHLALYTSLVDKLVDVVGRDAGLGRCRSKIEDLACQLADLAHRSNALCIVDVDLVAVYQGPAVLGVAVLPPGGVRN